MVWVPVTGSWKGSLVYFAEREVYSLQHLGCDIYCDLEQEPSPTSNSFSPLSASTFTSVFIGPLNNSSPQLLERVGVYLRVGHIALDRNHESPRTQSCLEFQGDVHQTKTRHFPPTQVLHTKCELSVMKEEERSLQPRAWVQYTTCARNNLQGSETQ